MSLQRKTNVNFGKRWGALQKRFSMILTQTNFQCKGMEIQSYVATNGRKLPIGLACSPRSVSARELLRGQGCL